MAISRKLPNSNPGRSHALDKALQQHTISGANTVLTNKTATDLAAIDASYKARQSVVVSAQAAAANSTNAKNTAQTSCSIYARHALQTVMMAVERGEIPPAALKLYQLDEHKPTLPPTRTEQEVLTAANNFIDGEQKRIAAGGTPLPMPTLVQVVTCKNDFSKALDQQDTDATALRDAQVDLNKLNDEADRVIKKVWDEAETFYNDLPDDTRRAYCRQWGVVYVSDLRLGITGVILYILNGAAVGIEGALLQITETEEKTESKTDGIFELKTNATGTISITISAAGFVPQTKEVTIEGKDVNLGEVTMVAHP